MNLADKHCPACTASTPKLSAEQAKVLLHQLDNWQITDAGRLAKSFKFSNFAQAMQLANKVAICAEEENHHPDLLVRWGELRVEIYTHAIDDLSENDFILAAKIDRLAADGRT